MDDDEEWDVPEIEGKVRWENSEFRKYVRSQKADDDIQTLLTEVQCHEKYSAAEDLIDFPESDEDDDNYDPDGKNSSDEEDEEEDKDEEEENNDDNNVEEFKGEGDETQSDHDNGGRDSPLTMLSAVGGRCADLSVVVDEFHRDPEEPAAAMAGAGGKRDRFTTPQNPKASFLSACSSNVSSSSGEFFSPGKRRSAAETAAAEEDDKDEYLLVDRLICNADNCQSGRLTNIPDIYCEKGIDFMCNECLVKASGHADCNREGCQICQIVGQELRKRLLLEKSFREGSLILEETISKQRDKTHEGSSEAVLSRYVMRTSNLYWNFTDKRLPFLSAIWSVRRPDLPLSAKGPCRLYPASIPPGERRNQYRSLLPRKSRRQHLRRRRGGCPSRSQLQQRFPSGRSSSSVARGNAKCETVAFTK